MFRLSSIPPIFTPTYVGTWADGKNTNLDVLGYFPPIAKSYDVGIALNNNIGMSL